MTRKFAIYDKGPNYSIEAWEYIDDLDTACKYWYVRDAIDRYGVEDVMPICMNKCGGYHTCYQPDVVAIIESDTWPSIATHPELFRSDINNSNFNYGWIDPDGNTYRCEYMQHAALAESLVQMFHPNRYTKWKLDNNDLNAPDDFLLNIGWIKVFTGSPGHCVFYEKTTDKALAKLDEIEGKRK